MFCIPLVLYWNQVCPGVHKVRVRPATRSEVATCINPADLRNLLISQDGIDQSTFPSIMTTNEADRNVLLILLQLNFNIYCIWLVIKQLECVVIPLVQLPFNGSQMYNAALHREIIKLCLALRIQVIVIIHYVPKVASCKSVCFTHSSNTVVSWKSAHGHGQS